MKKALIAGVVFLFPLSLLANNVTITTGGRVTIELLGSDAAFHNTLSVISPGVAVAITGCQLEASGGLGGVPILSENVSQHGCRVDLDADPSTPGIQGFASGTTFELGMCAQTDSDAPCEFVWSSDPAHNSDSIDHVHVTEIVAGQVFQLNWEDQSGGGDNDYNDLIAVLRVAADSDGDGLWDDWETNGIDTNGDGTIDLDLPALGANPRHKNIFLEIDWMDCTVAGSDCAAGDNHNHRPLAAAMTDVVNAFANASTVSNPDGNPGITVRIDVGNSIAHQNLLNIPGLCFSGGSGIGNFDTVKADTANFGPDNPKRFAYHYVLFTHRQLAGNTNSGCAELPGNDIQIAFGGWNYFCSGGTKDGQFCNSSADCPGVGASCQAGGDLDGDGNVDQDRGTVAQQAGTLMHELGHNLSLQHGGGDSVNWKPNYLSVMNYWFQLGWIPPTPRLDYSRSALTTLVETNLNEALGIQDGTDNTSYWCPNFTAAAGLGTGAIDWNCDGDTLDTALTADVNADPICVQANGVLDTAPSGDDFVSGIFILDGPDRTCNTAAAGNDFQIRGVGVAQPSLVGYDDWSNIKYDFQNTGAYATGVHESIVPVEELSFPQLFESTGPDVAVDVSASSSTIVTGRNVTYTIHVGNNRSGGSEDVTVIDTLPPALTFVSCSATGGGVCGGSGNNRTIGFTTIPGGGSATITIVATLDCSIADGTTIANSASAVTMPDSNPANNSAQVSITASNPPPEITGVSVSRNVLWPPNHNMADITVSYTVNDSCPVATSLSVTSNEPVNGTGDGDASPDWQVLDANHVRLRAERAGGGPGRVYTITIQATDTGGASSTATATVTVPLSQR